MSEHSLFREEEETIRIAEELLECLAPGDISWPSHYRNLVNKYRELLNQSTRSINVTACNSTHAQGMGASQDYVMQTNLFTNVKDSNAVAAIKKTLSGEISHSRDLYASVPGSKASEIECEFSPMISGEGARIGAIGLVEDVTERRKAEEALRKSEEKHRRIFENIQDVYLETLPDGTVMEISPSVKTVLGFSREDLVGSSVLAIYHVPEERRELIARLSENSVVRDYELSVKCRDGKVIQCSINARLIHDESTDTRYICGVMRDISKRKRTEEILKTTFLRFYTILSWLRVGVLLVSEGGRIEFVNQAFCDMFDLDDVPESLYGSTASELVQKVRELYDRPDEAVTRIQDIVARQRFVKSEEVAICGGRTYLRDFIPILVDGNRYGRLWHHQDITDRKKAEDRVKASLKEKEVLLREIHHRVKNNFQMIAGLITLQADHIADKVHQATLREAEARVLAMARIHEKLYQSDDLGKIRMDEYLFELAEDLVGFRGHENTRITLTAKMQPITFDIDSAIPCGLIVTELVTNALKHAFPEGGDGVIEITLEKIPGNEYELTVRDNGVGFPEDYSLQKNASLGLRLVQAFVKRFKGGIALGQHKGASVRINFERD